MMWSLIKKEILEHRTSLIIYCALCALSVWLYVAIFPSFQAQAQDLGKILDAMPKEILKAFGAEGTGLENVESLLATKQFGLIWPLLAVILMLNRAGNGLAGEIENGTLGTLLSQPLSRARIYLAKYISATATLGIFVVWSVLINIPIIAAYRLQYSLKYELLFAGVCTLFGLAILGIGIATSAAVSERSKVYGIIGGGVVLMFILNVVSGLKPALENLKYGSFFYYFNASEILVRHHINTVSIAVFIVTAILGFSAGLALFIRRDIST